MDTFDRATRSAVMAKVRSHSNRSTELRLITTMKEFGITGWRRRAPLLGKPDFVFRAERIAIFVDGCFWHGCPNCGEVPASNSEYWSKKIARNRKRDRRVAKGLRAKGWMVMRIWECALRERVRVAGRLRRALERQSKSRGTG